MNTVTLALAVALVLWASAAASAQPRTAAVSTHPVLALIFSATQEALSREQIVRGVITSINGKYGLTVKDDHSDTDRVTMHLGTIINPIGLQLTPGMQVTITGHPDSGTFDVDKIDAPIQYLEAQERARRVQANIAPLDPAVHAEWYLPDERTNGRGWRLKTSKTGTVYVFPCTKPRIAAAIAGPAPVFPDVALDLTRFDGRVV
jgi:hypothetical protein